jgi:hypothetical protein
MANNEMDTHPDTSCAGANWSLMELTGEICDVNPFLASYQPVLQKIPAARCCTVWMDQTNSMEYCSSETRCCGLAHSCPIRDSTQAYQMRAYGIGVYDDPFDTSRTFGIDSDPLDTTGAIVHFESHVPTKWEKTRLPIILLTSEDWNPHRKEMRTIVPHPLHLE